MLSYRHEFHAGNFADLIKHGALTLIIDYLRLKPAPIRYIDTHAGAGVYSTTSAMAAKTGEFLRGVGGMKLEDFPAEFASYRSVITYNLLQQEYPGSPLIASRLLRPQDELRLFELHSTEFPILSKLFANDRRVKVFNQDGFQSLAALLPVQDGRALVLIDPSYELQSDYQNVVACLQQGYSRMPHAVFAVWYPELNKPELKTMIDEITALVSGKLWRFELSDAPRAENHGMAAAGLLLINPPWVLGEKLAAAFEVLCPLLDPTGAAKYSGVCLKE